MARFTSLAGSALLYAQGRFREAALFSFEGQIYAQSGSSFIRLKRDGATSLRSTYWSSIELDQPHAFASATGNMVLMREQPAGLRVVA